MASMVLVQCHGERASGWRWCIGRSPDVFFSYIRRKYGGLSGRLLSNKKFVVVVVAVYLFDSGLCCASDRELLQMLHEHLQADVVRDHRRPRPVALLQVNPLFEN